MSFGIRHAVSASNCSAAHRGAVNGGLAKHGDTEGAMVCPSCLAEYVKRSDLFDIAINGLKPCVALFCSRWS